MQIVNEPWSHGLEERSKVPSELGLAQKTAFSRHMRLDGLRVLRVMGFRPLSLWSAFRARTPRTQNNFETPEVNQESLLGVDKVTQK